MNTLRLLRLPLAAIAAVAMLSGCGGANFITDPATDDAPPPAPAGISVQRNESGTAFLVWDPSASASVASYAVYELNPSTSQFEAVVDPNPTDTSFEIPAAVTVTTATFGISSVKLNGTRSSISTITTVVGPTTGLPGNPYGIE